MKNGNKTALAVGTETMAEAKFFMDYSRYLDDAGRYETWQESVDRVFDMHKEKYAVRLAQHPSLHGELAKARQDYIDKLFLGAQRALQFGGEQLRRHEAKIYNCSVSHADRVDFFSEAMYLLLCGCGVGFSVQEHHVRSLPAISERSKEPAKVFTVPDSIEGWADSFGVLLASFFEEGEKHQEYRGQRVVFDFSLIRPKGAKISGGFKAPGPDGLRLALQKCEALLEKQLDDGFTMMRPIVVYDFVMHMSDAVLSGGVRRSATICLFDKWDTEMLKAKTGNWWQDNPQRGRSNNSVVIKRDELTRFEWAQIMRSVKDYGEPGFIFTDNVEFCYNPCVEIGMLPRTEDGVSGFQFCNLTEINGGACIDKETFFRACESAAIMGTLQAGYTDFKYLSDATRRITEREALIGVSITGWMNNPNVLFDEETLKKGADIVKETNKRVAALLGINQAARTTCVKPSGNASVLLKTASGIHGEHAPMYFRHVQMNMETEVAQLIKAINPKMIEQSAYSSTGADYVVAFPVVAKEGSNFKGDLRGVSQLEYVKKAQQYWVNSGTNVDLCVDSRLRHNVSNTIDVSDWDEVEQYIFDNRQWFAGISLLAAQGDKAYFQAPFQEVKSAEDLLQTYGVASMFASGLIVDGMHAFGENLWIACTIAETGGSGLSESVSDLLKRDWVRRYKKFADNFFDGDVMKTSHCLKDTANLHKWHAIVGALKAVDFSALSVKKFVEVDTIASQACAGGKCEVSFA
jgi:ribonucleoside-triphosphate reductase